MIINMPGTNTYMDEKINIAKKLTSIQAMLNLKTNINGKARIFSSNIKRDRIFKHYY